MGDPLPAPELEVRNSNRYDLKPSAAALAYARQLGFSALVFSDVKPPTGQSAAYTQAAADGLHLHQMGLTALEPVFSIFYY